MTGSIAETTSVGVALRFEADLEKTTGIAGETKMRIIVNSATKVITAFPISDADVTVPGILFMNTIPTSSIDYLEGGANSDIYQKLISEVLLASQSVIESVFFNAEQDNRAIQDTATIQLLVIDASQGVELRFSRYGRLVTITNEDKVENHQVENLMTILNNSGFSYLSERSLEAPFRERERMNEDWFHSYFDYA